MTEQQQPTSKEKLVALIRSHVAAATSGDPLLQDFAARNLSGYLEIIEITEPSAEEPETAASHS